MIRPRSVSGKVLLGFGALMAAFVSALAGWVLARTDYTVPAADQPGPTALIVLSVLLGLTAVAIWTVALLQAAQATARKPAGKARR